MGTTPERAESLPRIVYDLWSGRFLLVTRPSCEVLLASVVTLNRAGVFAAYCETRRF